jgi:hypothetical protein
LRAALRRRHLRLRLDGEYEVVDPVYRYACAKAQLAEASGADHAGTKSVEGKVYESTVEL